MELHYLLRTNARQHRLVNCDDTDARVVLTPCVVNRVLSFVPSCRQPLFKFIILSQDVFFHHLLCVICRFYHLCCLGLRQLLLILELGGDRELHLILQALPIHH